MAGGENRRLLERNAWKEQRGWEKKAARAGLVGEDAKGHLRDGIVKMQQRLDIPKNQWEKSKGSQHAAKSQALSVPDTNSIGSPEYHASSKAFFLERTKIYNSSGIYFYFIL